MTKKMQNITPMMKSPYELMIFLLCLELFHKNGAHRLKLIQYTLDLRKPDLRKNLDLRKIVGATDLSTQI